MSGPTIDTTGQRIIFHCVTVTASISAGFVQSGIEFPGDTKR